MLAQFGQSHKIVFDIAFGHLRSHVLHENIEKLLGIRLGEHIRVVKLIVVHNASQLRVVAVANDAVEAEADVAHDSIVGWVHCLNIDEQR